MHTARRVVINKVTRLNCYIVLLLLQEKGDKSSKQVALERKEPFPFIIIEGTLDAPEEASMQFRGKPLRSNSWAASLLLCFYVQSSTVFKVNDAKKLPTSVITFVNEIDSLPIKGLIVISLL